MEPIAGTILNLGVAGAVVAAVLYYLPKAIGKLQEQREADATWLRNELQRSRTDYVESIDRVQASFSAVLEKTAMQHAQSESHWREVTESLKSAIEELVREVRVSRYSQHVTPTRPRGAIEEQK